MSTLRMMAIDAICQRGSVRDADVVMLRRAFLNDSQISASDVDALFRVHALARIQDPSWADFFIDTMTDYVVRELEPVGYVTASHAGWIIARVSSGGHVRTKTEHDLLLNIIDKARWVPESLLAFALTQIRNAVSDGDGPLRPGGTQTPGTITVAEIEQLRAMIFAYGTDGPRAVTQTEIDILLDIDAAIATGADDGDQDAVRASWTDLFSKASANAMLSASGYAGPTREEAMCEGIALWRPVRTGEARLALVGGPALDILGSYRQLPVEARALMRLELQRVEIITGEPVTIADAERIAARVHLSGRQTTCAGVLELLKAAGVSLHPALALNQGNAGQAAIHAA